MNPCPLTPRQLEVLDYLARGLTRDAVAAQLGIDPWTVKAHTVAILVRLRVRNITAAAVLAAHEGWIGTGEVIRDRVAWLG